MAVPRSYRSLVEALEEEEAVVFQLECEAQTAHEESKALREQVLSEALLHGAIEENVAALEMYLNSAKAEAAVAWTKYEEPLQREALALAVSRRASRELEEQSARGFEVACNLQEEAQSLEHHLDHLDQHHKFVVTWTLGGICCFNSQCAKQHLAGESLLASIGTFI
eukprot:symbB.v1.2.028828.t1/scaffold3092.1/size63782/8